jgi:hypothetical protein
MEAQKPVHTREHVSKLCKILFTPNSDEIDKRRTQWWDLLDYGKIEEIAEEARQIYNFPTVSRGILRRVEINRPTRGDLSYDPDIPTTR